MVEQFKAGDLVQLKSGGPIMTVKMSDDYGEWICEWFDGVRQETRELSVNVAEKRTAANRTTDARGTAGEAKSGCV